MKIEKCSGRMENWENFRRSLRNCSEIGGNLKQGEMHHCLRWDGRPCVRLHYVVLRYTLRYYAASRAP